MATPVSIIAYPFTSQVTFDEADLPVYDRAVDSEVLRNINRQYFSDGVFAVPATSFQVATADSGLNVQVFPGSGNINGTTGYRLEATTLAIEPPGGAARTDAIVLRWDESIDVRAIQLDVVKGTGTAQPTPTRTDTIIELVLAYVNVRATATQILVTDIEDTRLNTDLCGLVRLPMTVPDTDPYFAQIQGMIEALREVIDGVIDGSQYMLKTQYAPDATETINDENNTRTIVSENSRALTRYPLSFIAAEDYNNKRSLVVDGVAMPDGILNSKFKSIGNKAWLEGAPVNLMRVDDKIFQVSGSGGGSSDMPFVIVGGQTRPNEQDFEGYVVIWVQHELTSLPYYIGATRPSNPQAGLVYISNDKPHIYTLRIEESSDVYMGIGMPQLFASNNAWTIPHSEIFINGAWEDFRNPIIYDHGKQYVPWVIGQAAQGSTTTFEINHMYCHVAYGTSYGAASFITSEPIDVTGYNQMRVWCSEIFFTSAGNFVWVRAGLNSSTPVVVSPGTGNFPNNIVMGNATTGLAYGQPEIFYTVNISAVSGLVYPYIAVISSGSSSVQRQRVTKVELI